MEPNQMVAAPTQARNPFEQYDRIPQEKKDALKSHLYSALGLLSDNDISLGEYLLWILQWDVKDACDTIGKNPIVELAKHVLPVQYLESASAERKAQRQGRNDGPTNATDSTQESTASTSKTTASTETNARQNANTDKSSDATHKYSAVLLRTNTTQERPTDRVVKIGSAKDAPLPQDVEMESVNLLKRSARDITDSSSSDEESKSSRGDRAEQGSKQRKKRLVAPSQARTVVAATVTAQVPAPQGVSAAPDAAKGLPRPTASQVTKEVHPIPPVIIRDTRNWNHISLRLKENGIQFGKAKVTADGIRMELPSADAHRAATKFLTAAKIPHHTYTIHEEKDLRIVIRGIPVDMEVREVEEDLRRQGLQPTSVVRMTKRDPRERGKKVGMPLILVQIPRDQRRIYDLTTCCSLAIRVESLQNRASIGQCHKCQRFGHGQRRCSGELRCVRCAGPHSVSECDAQANKCANCEGPHAASYRGCPKFVTKGTQPARSAEAPSKPVIPKSQKPKSAAKAKTEAVAKRTEEVPEVIAAVRANAGASGTTKKAGKKAAASKAPAKENAAKPSAKKAAPKQDKKKQVSDKMQKQIADLVSKIAHDLITILVSD